MEKKILKELTPEKLKQYKPCPKHGKDYLRQEGIAVFCYAEIPDDIISRCFYHVGKNRSRRRRQK